MNKDPFEEGGGLNLYVFVDNNSLNFFDSDGLLPKSFSDRINKIVSKYNQLVNEAEEKIKNSGRTIKDQTIQKYREIREKSHGSGSMTYTLQDRKKIRVGPLWGWNYGYKVSVKETLCKIKINGGFFGGGRLKTPKIIWGANFIIGFSVNGTVQYEYDFAKIEEEADLNLKFTVNSGLRWGVGIRAWGFGAEGFVEGGVYGVLSYDFLMANNLEDEKISGGFGGYVRAVYEIGTPTSVNRFEEKFTLGYGVESGVF